MKATPATKIMMRALELSEAANGIPGAVDSNDKNSYVRAKKRLRFDEDDAGPSTTPVDLDESVEEEEQRRSAAKSPSATDTGQSPNKGTPKSVKSAKRLRADARKSVGRVCFFAFLRCDIILDKLTRITIY